MKEFEYYNPKSVAETLNILENTKNNNRIIAGGTDVLLMMNDGRIGPDHVINIQGVGELKYIVIEKSLVRIGAASTFTDVEQNEYIKKKIKGLYEACAHVGSPQIRNLGTVGGNVINASVAGDSISVFLSLGANLIIRSSKGKRKISLREYYNGGNQTRIQPDELLTEIQFKKPDNGVANAFFKLGKRNALAIVDIGAAVTICRNAEQTCTSAKIIGGALSRYPLEFTKVQEYLIGKKINRQTFANTYEMLQEAVYESIKDRPMEVYYKQEAVRGTFDVAFEDILRQYEERSDWNEENYDSIYLERRKV
ncbi:FAD binding domain-containing protein [Hespellia stercorisuis]|uniref:Carbon-monoxide dehydrogenase medium subunit n=1 Tax=Hespellia stercorisuis DSM 15480 TaxID=1121950 RepID=A0A1M6VE56_9FIRM|nr:FAD binding domain-containing protein [Hespellia stercorisuis]SHK79739.1 carbon-monoxide dehydrogenase medium subunit [Hespellia stercorisuis DSM 15480]